MKLSFNKAPVGGACTHLLSLFLALFSLAFSSASHAEVHFVYRFDNRPPAEIFQNGFRPRGQNLDLLQHVLFERDVLTENGAAGSGFIATTRSYGVALQLAEVVFGGVEHSSGYIYRIAVDDSFYDVHHSLVAFLGQGIAAGVTDRYRSLTDRLEDAIHAYEHQEEFATNHAIPPSRISGVIPVRLERPATGSDLQVTQGEFEDNPNAPDAFFASANPNPYPMAWPSGDETSSSSCEASSSDTDSDGPIGPDCVGDLFAIAGPSGYLDPSQFPDCGSPREKRDQGSCKALPQVNVSKRMRILRVMTSDL